MADTAASVVATALTHHHPHPRTSRSMGIPEKCECGARNLHYGDRWENHLADIAVAALTQAGHLPSIPITTRSDYTAEATWRAAALNVIAAWHASPIPGVDVATIQQEDITQRWPSLADAIRTLDRAKANLLREHP